jgi:pilus assembly protein CpaB
MRHMATKKYSLILFSSLGVAAVATLLVFRLISASTTRNQIPTLAVVVAAKDIAEGAEILEGDVRIERWPEPVVPENAFESPVRVGGRVSRVAIYAGEAIVPGKLAPEGATPGLEAKITPGHRAMGVRINDVSGMNGMIQPNSRVDILLTPNAAEGSETRTAKLFMENMRVLAMGSQVTRGADGRVAPSSVAMIEVTPEESEMLALAQARGQIQLVLRGFSEPNGRSGRTKSEEVAAALRDAAPVKPKVTAPPVRSTPAPRPVEPVVAPVVQAPKPAAPRNDSTTIQVWRGPKRSDEKLGKDSTKKDTIRRGN